MLCVYAFSVRTRQGIFENQERMHALHLGGWLNEFGIDIARVVGLADTNPSTVHRNLEEFLVVR